MLTLREGSNTTWFIAVIKIPKILFAFSLVTGRTEPLHNCATKLFLPWYAWSFYLTIVCSWFIYHVFMPHTVNFSTPVLLIFLPSRCHCPQKMEKSKNSVNLLFSSKNMQQKEYFLTNFELVTTFFSQVLKWPGCLWASLFRLTDWFWIQSHAMHSVLKARLCFIPGITW